MESFKSSAAEKLPPVPRPKRRQADKRLEVVPQAAKKPEVVELGAEDLIEDTDEAVELNDADLISDEEEVELEEIREPGELQMKDVEPPFEVNGFDGLQVAATLEKKNERKGKADERNEDNIIADPATGLIGVLDGLGGEGNKGAGSRASMSAETQIPEAYAAAMKEAKKKRVSEIADDIVSAQLARLNITDPAKRAAKQRELADMFEGVVARDPEMGRKAAALLESIRNANDATKETGGKTTACVGFIHKGPDGKSYAVVANIGDSVAFKRRKNGEVVPLTSEDSLLNLMTAAGAISPEQLEAMKREPKKKIPFPISLELVQAMGGDQKAFEGLRDKGITELPLDYKTLKRAMSRSMGADKAEAALTIRAMEPGDELIMGTDIFDNFENKATEEMDTGRIAQAAGGTGTQKERLNRLREAAKNGDKDDDAAIVMARVL